MPCCVVCPRTTWTIPVHPLPCPAPLSHVGRPTVFGRPTPMTRSLPISSDVRPLSDVRRVGRPKSDGRPTYPLCTLPGSQFSCFGRPFAIGRPTSQHVERPNSV